VELVALAQATALLSCRGQAAHLPVLVHGLCDPLGVRVASDGLVEGVDQNHLEELVGGVLAHPVGVKNSQRSTVTTSALLRGQPNTRPGKLPTQEKQMQNESLVKTLTCSCFVADKRH
uniref:Uncharacterized protein n=1 Tax=Poecilia reticulata TaxID=8081 RepID=A0A3P9PF29_POERE